MSPFHIGMLIGGFIGVVFGFFCTVLILSSCQVSARESVYCRGRRRYFEIAKTQPDYDSDCVDDDFGGKR